MQAESPHSGVDLRQLLSRTAETVSYSGKKMMKSAGLSWQTLSAWKAGSRQPRAESLRAVGQALLVRAERIRQIGLELIQAAEQVPSQHRPSSTADDGPQHVLFSPSGSVSPTRRPPHGDRGNGPSNG